MIVDRIRGLARVPGSRLRAADENFRVHDARQRKVLKGLLAEVGIIGAVLAWVPDDMARAALRSSQDFAAWLAGYDGPLQLVDGHMRAEELRGQAIPVFVTDLSRAEAAKALATFDAVGDLAGRDAQKLAALLEDVGRGSEEGTEELLAALREAPKAEPPPAGDDPEAPSPGEALLEKWKVERGQTWAIGPHRLLCWDSRDRERLASFAGAERPGMMWTDPPYGVSYVGKTADAMTIENDDLSGDKLRPFLAEAFAAAPLSAGAAAYVATPARSLHIHFLNAIADVGWRLHQTLVWVKSAFALGHSDYHYRHEPVLLAYLPGGGRRGRGGDGWYGDNAQDSIFEFDKPSRNGEHPTMKPVELVEAMVRNSSPVGGLVFDPFCGSGTTLVAAHRLGRRGLGVELSPAYCAVILERLSALGLEPRLS